MALKTLLPAVQNMRPANVCVCVCVCVCVRERETERERERERVQNMRPAKAHYPPAACKCITYITHITYITYVSA